MIYQFFFLVIEKNIKWINFLNLDEIGDFQTENLFCCFQSFVFDRHPEKTVQGWSEAASLSTANQSCCVGRCNEGWRWSSITFWDDDDDDGLLSASGGGQHSDSSPCCVSAATTRTLSVTTGIMALTQHFQKNYSHFTDISRTLWKNKKVEEKHLNLCFRIPEVKSASCICSDCKFGLGCSG